MRAVPVDPVFLFDPKTHWIDLWETAKATLTVAAFLGAKRFEFVGYDANLSLWTVSWKSPELSLWNRIANLAGHSRMSVPVHWTDTGRYKIGELRQNFIEAVVHDDDVLTQLVEPEELIRRLRECDTFLQLAQAWQWLKTDTA